MQINQFKTISIIIPTYNEANNIIRLIDEICKYIPSEADNEIIIVDDNSPDKTGIIAENYAKNVKNVKIRVVHRKRKSGLSSAIIDGINIAKGENILVMDADFSHPPSLIPQMIKELENNDLVIASRYVNGSKIVNWPLKRKLLSNTAKKIAKHTLRLTDINDPLSGFFGFKKKLVKNIHFDALGYKLLLEIIVKAKDVKIKEISYTFVNRSVGKSKLDMATIIDYIRSIWRLYRYGRKHIAENRRSVLFISKTARFYTVGVSGLFVNYCVTLLLSTLSPILYANLGGIISSITSNFILNKIWTFEDKNFARKHVIKQYSLYSLFGSIGAAIQLSLTNLLIDRFGYDHSLALLIAVGVASIGNFLFNKRLTFKERLWG